MSNDYLMTYEEALNYIHGTHKFGIKLGLENIGVLLDLLGNPHKKLKYVHIAGTNGKGSTASFVWNILFRAGYRVGVYTSPYLEKFNERICINGRPIEDDELAKLTFVVKNKVANMLEEGCNHPTEFEIVTAIAFLYFYEQKCDIVVLETGLGGRFDSTNIIDAPEVAVITTIDYDHMNILGNTLKQIAFEKAGIIKKDSIVILGDIQDKGVLKVFEQVCNEKNAVLKICDFNSLELKNFGVNGQVFDYNGFLDIEIKLLGEHQVKNAVLGINVINILKDNGYKIDKVDIYEGLKNTKWPGRFEVLSVDPLFIIDGAHNLAGVKALIKSLKKYFYNKRKIFIIGLLKDKDIESILELAIPECSYVIAVTPSSERALNASELADYTKKYCKNTIVCEDPLKVFDILPEITKEGDVICAFGSLYYIGIYRNYFRKKI